MVKRPIPFKPKNVTEQTEGLGKRLREIWRVWILNGDVMTCRGCGLSIPAAREAENFYHAHECPHRLAFPSDDPWTALRLAVIDTTPVRAIDQEVFEWRAAVDAARNRLLGSEGWRRLWDWLTEPSPAGALPVPFPPAADTFTTFTKPRAPMEEHIMQFFTYDHLPVHLQEVSKPFAELAHRILELPRNPERTVALRKLLESKDAAVRARKAGEDGYREC